MGHLPAMDFETYSEAGYRFMGGYFVPLMKGKPGIQAVNAPVYAEHPSTRIISLAYDLLDGCGVRLWLPTDSGPEPLFNYFKNGGIIEAHNSTFEYYIWTYVCHLRMGWPQVPLHQYRCSAAKARSWGLPGSLENISNALNPTERKSTRGKELIRLLSVPKKPTAKDSLLYRTFEKYPDLHYEMYSYNDQDVRAEMSVSSMMPEISEFETLVWLLDQRINSTGVSIDYAGLQACIQMFRQAEAKYTAELKEITGEEIQTVDEISKGSAGDKWLIARGFNVDSLDKSTIDIAVDAGEYLNPSVLRVLQIRQIIGGSSVKKLFAMERYLNSDGKIRDLFQYCGAERTGRFAGRGPQPQNLKNSGPELDGREWGNTLAEQALSDIHVGNLEAVESKWGNAVDLIGSCMRSLFVATPGYDFICSDYSAIEAVVLAAMAGEEWRLEVFRTHGKIYEASIAKTTGTPLEEILDYKRQTGKHHPLRKKGKVRELAGGYGGWIGAWKNFGASAYMTDSEIKQDVIQWRADSPMIVEMWGGQYRKYKKNYEPHGVEGMAVMAIMNRGVQYRYRDVGFYVDPEPDVFYIILPSGRSLSYHSPRLTLSTDPLQRQIQQISFM